MSKSSWGWRWTYCDLDGVQRSIEGAKRIEHLIWLQSLWCLTAVSRCTVRPSQMRLCSFTWLSNAYFDYLCAKPWFFAIVTENSWRSVDGARLQHGVLQVKEFGCLGALLPEPQGLTHDRWLHRHHIFG